MGGEVWELMRERYERLRALGVDESIIAEAVGSARGE